VTDYLDVLAAPERREAFLSGVADCLAQHGGAYAAIDLCNIPEGSPTLESLPRLLAERGFAVRVKLQEVCPTIALPGDFETYLGQLDKKQRHEARRKLRRAEEAEDKVEWYIVGPQHDLAAETERFIQLMAASHPEKDAFLQDPKNMAFFRALVPKMAACGWLQLSFLTANGNPAAAYLNFDYNNRIQVYNSGLVPASYSHLSPGIVLLLYNIRHAIEIGRSHFDFLRGNQDYKYRMGAQDFRVMNLEATRDGLDSLPSPERDEKK
jgi:CelD/BcsL family acetyltransferase involved in cellulose biosynthesis